ncbi:hypothetical protein OROHE_016431 [Orobanche hederae]
MRPTPHAALLMPTGPEIYAQERASRGSWSPYCLYSGRCQCSQQSWKST